MSFMTFAGRLVRLCRVLEFAPRLVRESWDTSSRGSKASMTGNLAGRKRRKRQRDRARLLIRSSRHRQRTCCHWCGEAMTSGRDSKETPEDLELIYRAALDGRLERAFEHFFTEATGRAPTSLEEMKDYFCEKKRQRAAATGSWEEVGLTLRHEWAALKNSVDFSEQLRRVGIVPEAPEPPQIGRASCRERQKA